MFTVLFTSRSVLFECNETPEQQEADIGMLQTFSMRPVNNFGSNIVKSQSLNSADKGN